MADSKSIVGSLIDALRKAAPELGKKAVGSAIQGIRDAVENAVKKGTGPKK